MLLHELRDAIAGCPIPEDEVVAPEDVLERPQACYRVILDAGERSMVESDIRLFKTDTEAINWFALEADRRGFMRWQCVQE
jgi:hypothetical protein